MNSVCLNPYSLAALYNLTNAPVMTAQAFLTRRHEKTGVLGGLTGPGPNTAIPRSSLGPQKTSLHTTGSRWSFSHSRVSHFDLSVCGVF